MSTPQQAARVKLIGSLTGAAFAVVASWVLYIGHAFFKYDLIHFETEDRHSPATFLYIAIAVTVIAALWGLYRWRTLTRLAARGQFAAGTVTAVGIFSKHGRRPTTVSYRVNGTAYTIRQDTSKGLKTGDRCQILYDPQKPASGEIVG